MKVAIYTRVSTHWQIDKDSLKVQRRELLQYAELMLGTKDCVVFEDAGFSAKNTDRPQYREMMSRIRAKEFTHLLVWKIDRISRNLLDFVTMYSELKALSVTFISKNEAFDTSSAIGEAMLKIILVFAELERQMTSERVTAVMLSRAKGGEWNGGRIPFGYEYDKDTKTFSLNRQESLVVKKIFRTYEATQSVIATTRIMNDTGIRTRAGASWSTVGIHKILRNPFYIGTYRYNVHAPEGKHPEAEWTLIENHHVPLIERDQFDRVQDILSRNKKLDTNSVNYYTQNCYIFSGLVFCGHCGSKMTPNSARPQKSGYVAANYGCTKRRYKGTYCSNRYVQERILSDFVFTLVHNILSVSTTSPSEPSLFALQESLLAGMKNVTGITGSSLRAFYEATGGNNVPLSFTPMFTNVSSDERDIAVSEIKRSEASLKRAKTLFLNGGLSQEEYDSTVVRLNAQIDNLQKALPEDGSEFREKADFYLLADLLTTEPFSPNRFDSLVSKRAKAQFAKAVIKRMSVTDGHVTDIEFASGLRLEFKYATN